MKNNNSNNPIVILGAGIAGLSAAYYLKHDYQIFEKDSRAGGLCKSVQIKGYTFDSMGHWLHFKDQNTKSFIENELKVTLGEHSKEALIYLKKRFTKHPFEINAYGLPFKIILECFWGLLQSKFKKNNQIINFEDWIYAYLGKGIAKYFMIPYNQKLHQTHPKNMSTEWLGRFVPKPKIIDYLRGAIGLSQTGYSYNAKMYYPLVGGIETMVKAYLPHLKKINLNMQATSIDFKKKTVTFQNGSQQVYSQLITTIPLPQLLMIINPPTRIRVQIEKLQWVSVASLHLGVNKKIDYKDWIYIPEKEYCFSRVGFFSNINPNMAPLGKTAIYTEVSFLPNKHINLSHIKNETIKDLLKMGIIDNPQQIEVIDSHLYDYAYVIYNKDWKDIRQPIFNFLSENKIYSIGRYGCWEYSSMEEAILEGKGIAVKLNADR